MCCVMHAILNKTSVLILFVHLNIFQSILKKYNSVIQTAQIMLEI